MALVRLQERCRGFTEVLEDSREFTYSHNERMWLEDTSETLPDGTTLITWRKFCNACADAKQDLDAQ
jgi:hypothetical protein